jgi:hypothetical protein
MSATERVHTRKRKTWGIDNLWNGFYSGLMSLGDLFFIPIQRLLGHKNIHLCIAQHVDLWRFHFAPHVTQLLLWFYNW